MSTRTQGHAKAWTPNYRVEVAAKQKRMAHELAKATRLFRLLRITFRVPVGSEYSVIGRINDAIPIDVAFWTGGHPFVAHQEIIGSADLIIVRGRGSCLGRRRAGRSCRQRIGVDIIAWGISKACALY